MSDHDRGPYSPRDEKPLSFDARRPVRGERAVPVAFLISAGILVVLIVAIVFAYRSGVRGSDEAPMAVGEPVGEFKAPASEQAKTDTASGLQIYSETDGAAPAAQPTFTPPPEEPQPRPAPQTTPIPAAVPAPKNAPVAAQPTTPAPQPKAAPAPALPPGALPSPRAAVPAPAPAAPAGGVSVQVGAFASPAQAQRGWADAVRIAPGAAAGKGQAVEEVTVNGRTLYRSLVTGFDNRAAAQSFCASITAAGGNCLVR